VADITARQLEDRQTANLDGFLAPAGAGETDGPSPCF